MQFLGVKELERLRSMRAQVRLENGVKEVQSVKPAYPLFSVTPSPTTSDGQYSEVLVFLYFGHTGYCVSKGIVWLTWDIGMHGYPNKSQAGPTSA
jgi:hypothetical protein